MNAISKRLNEPVGGTWRQTYKALQLLEFLILNGSEQVIDDAKRRQFDVFLLLKSPNPQVKGCLSYNFIDGTNYCVKLILRKEQRPGRK
jgi:hypothetical protein